MSNHNKPVYNKPVWLGGSFKLLKGNPNLPSTPTYTVPTLTVGELRKALEVFDDNDPVGIGMLSMSGWVQGLSKVVKDEFGCIVLTWTEECLYSEEVNEAK